MSDIAKIDSARAALLVMDYQAGIIGMIPHADALLATAQLAVQAARKHGVRVGYVRVAFTEPEFEAVPERNKGFASLKTSGRNFHADDPVTAIDRRVAPHEGEIVVRKTRVGAFFQPRIWIDGYVSLVWIRSCLPGSAPAAWFFPLFAMWPIAITGSSSFPTLAPIRRLMSMRC